jgi:hypothetical protein
MPGRRNCGRFISTADQVQFAHLIDVGYFQSRICHPNAHSFDLVPDPELVGVVSSRTNSDSKFGTLSAYCSFDPQCVSQIGVASLIEGAGQPDARLDRSDYSRPLNLFPHRRASRFSQRHAAIGVWYKPPQ